MQKEEGRRKREEGRRKKEEGRGSREEGRGKKEEVRGKKALVIVVRKVRSHKIEGFRNQERLYHVEG
jgi:hypothetical protein